MGLDRTYNDEGAPEPAPGKEQAWTFLQGPSRPYTAAAYELPIPYIEVIFPCSFGAGPFKRPPPPPPPFLWGFFCKNFCPLR